MTRRSLSRAARCACCRRDETHQRVLSSRLDIKPLPVFRNERQDFFGNRVVDVSLETAHRQLRVEARSRVEVRRDEPSLLRTSPAWEEVSRRAFASHTLAPSSPSHFALSEPARPAHRADHPLRARELSGRRRDHRRRGRSHASHPRGFPSTIPRRRRSRRRFSRLSRGGSASARTSPMS